LLILFKTIYYEIDSIDIYIKLKTISI